MKKLSVVILTKNEEKNIADCIKNLKFADEILIIDDGSEDKTIERAKKLGARVYKQKLDNFTAQRNFALTKAKAQWVLFIDADERVSDSLGKEICLIIQKSNNDKNQIDGFWIPRKNRIFNKFFQHTDWYPDYQLRLFKNGKAKYKRAVHEKVEIEGNTSCLKNPIIHYNYDTVDQFIVKNYMQYADYEAQILLEGGYLFNLKDLVEKPVSEFLRRFYAGKGYKDGVHGLIASVLVAFATFIVYVKIWEKQGFKEREISINEIEYGLKSKSKNFRYWFKKVKLDSEDSIIKKGLIKLLG
jgi:glycosyltransferase involved in cell wall biosynthesis